MPDYPLASSETELNIGATRYTSQDFPPYRYVPGLHPHPTNSPDGHSYDEEDEEHKKWDSELWKTNQGYGTKPHQAGLLRLGVTPHHRRSFKPIHKILCEDSFISR